MAMDEKAPEENETTRCAQTSLLVTSPIRVCDFSQEHNPFLILSHARLAHPDTKVSCTLHIFCDPDKAPTIIFSGLSQVACQSTFLIQLLIDSKTINDTS